MDRQDLLRIVLLAMSVLSCAVASELFNSEPAEPAAPGTVAINELVPKGAGDESPWVELANRATSPVSLRGVVLIDGDGERYTFPDDLPDLPAGSFIVVHFDGQGPESNEFNDQGVVTHTADMVDPFNAAGDQLALYAAEDLNPDQILDFVAWGEPPVDAEDAVEAGIWQMDAFVNAARGGEIEEATQAGVSLGLYPEAPSEAIESWVVYPASETTSGEENGLPSPDVLIPAGGALLLSQDFRLTWYNVPFASEYRLQLDDDPAFGSPEVDVTLAEPHYAPSTPPADGAYTWRVMAVDPAGRESAFSEPLELTIATVEPLTLPAEPIEGEDAFPVSLGLEGAPIRADLVSQAGFWQVDYLNTLAPILQRKDSNLVCFDGDDESGARQAWDAPHADTPGNHSRHGRNYCARASIAMINHYYGGDLSQDRITYQHFGRSGWPGGDLGHDKPLSIAAGRNLLSWALNGAAVNLTIGKPTFAQIQQWTTEGRAVMAGVPGHAIALRGWAIYNGANPTIPRGTQFVIFNDPWDARMHVQSYPSLQLTNTRVPGGSPTGRMQEASVTQDPDSDTLMSFDEANRLRTDPELADTDDDCIPDKPDLHSYLYSPHNTYHVRLADMDGDGLWKQQDSDNDNGGVIDGDEDANLDGHLGPAETNNFASDDDGPRAGSCHPTPAPDPTATSGVSLPPTVPPTEVVVLDGSYLASVIILIDEAQHDSGPQCFICMPDEIELSITIDSVTVSGPAPWVEVSGDLNDDGSFTAAGRGTVAGFPGIAVTLAGTLTAEGLSAEYTMGAEGGLPGGLPIVYQVDGERMASELAQDALVEIASFLQTFNEAFAAGDVETLLANLHSEVFERYGEEPCRAYLEITVENPIMIEPLSVIMFGPWEYERDGVTSTIEDVYTIDAEITVRGETNRRDFHLAQSEEGVLTWFTDCGTPQ